MNHRDFPGSNSQENSGNIEELRFLSSLLALNAAIETSLGPAIEEPTRLVPVRVLTPRGHSRRHPGASPCPPQDGVSRNRKR